MNQIVWVNGQAMATDTSTWIINVKIPFGPCGFDDVHNIYLETFEDQSKLIHKCDVEIPLNVFDELCRFCRLDALDRNHVFSVALIELRCYCSPLRRNAANNSHGIADTVLRIPGIIAFGAVGKAKVRAGL